LLESYFTAIHFGGGVEQLHIRSQSERHRPVTLQMSAKSQTHVDKKTDRL
jgi:hypothetical protein